MSWLLLLLGCPAPSDTAVEFAPDLTEVLDETEARAGVITDASVLFGGAAGEGRLGDVLLYNDRARFVVQGLRETAYYIGRGGGVLDADVVRAPGEPGRDVLDDMAAMIGLGRGVAPVAVTVVEDGTDGSAAVVEVTGTGSALRIVTGTLESEDLIVDAELSVVTTYTLQPGSPLLDIQTEVTWLDEAATLQVGDLLLVGMEDLERYYPGRGLADDGDIPAWLGLISRRDDIALALFPEGEDGYPDTPLADLLSALGPVIGGVEEPRTVQEGETFGWSRRLGVGDDLAQLTDAWLEGSATQTISGTVRAADNGVPGVRVHVLDPDGEPWTLALTDTEGAFSVQVPDDGVYSVVAEGRGSGYQDALPAGAGPYPPFAHPLVQQLALDSLTEGAPGPARTIGYGVSEAVVGSEAAELTLTAPGTLAVDAGDGLPMVVRVAFADGDPVEADEQLTRERPGGDLSWGYAHAGSIALSLEPGTYQVTVHRGARWEPVQQRVTIESGATETLAVTLEEAWSIPGVYALDPHSHAAPSGDGEIPLVDRLLVHAAHGLDVHVGSDHDGVADYRPVVSALGLDDLFASVVADEVSPVVRGHFNAYPIEPDTGNARGGAPAWWQSIPETTSALWADAREWAGEDAIFQANHPTDTQGMFEAARLSVSSGTVENGAYWSDDFQAVEVLNRSHWVDNTEAWLMLVNRGFTPTPMGASDSHSYRDAVGENFTFVHTGTAAFDEEGLRQAVAAHATVPSRGPMVLATIDGEWAPGRTVSEPVTLEVEVLAPSWILPDTLELLQDGEVVATESIEGDVSGVRHATSFDLEPDADASYVLLVTGDTPMSPVYPGATPWALTAPVWVDVDGDGWEPPGGALAVEE